MLCFRKHLFSSTYHTLYGGMVVLTLVLLTAPWAALAGDGVRVGMELEVEPERGFRFFAKYLELAPDFVTNLFVENTRDALVEMIRESGMSQTRQFADLIAKDMDIDDAEIWLNFAKKRELRKVLRRLHEFPKRIQYEMMIRSRPSRFPINKKFRIRADAPADLKAAMQGMTVVIEETMRMEFVHSNPIRNLERYINDEEVLSRYVEVETSAAGRTISGDPYQFDYQLNISGLDQTQNPDPTRVAAAINRMLAVEVRHRNLERSIDRFELLEFTSDLRRRGHVRLRGNALEVRINFDPPEVELPRYIEWMTGTEDSSMRSIMERTYEMLTPEVMQKLLKTDHAKLIMLARDLKVYLGKDLPGGRAVLAHIIDRELGFAKALSVMEGDYIHYSGYSTSQGMYNALYDLLEQDPSLADAILTAAKDKNSLALEVLAKACSTTPLPQCAEAQRYMATVSTDKFAPWEKVRWIAINDLLDNRRSPDPMRIMQAMRGQTNQKAIKSGLQILRLYEPPTAEMKTYLLDILAMEAKNIQSMPNPNAPNFSAWNTFEIIQIKTVAAQTLLEKFPGDIDGIKAVYALKPWNERTYYDRIASPVHDQRDTLQRMMLQNPDHPQVHTLLNRMLMDSDSSDLANTIIYSMGESRWRHFPMFRAFKGIVDESISDLIRACSAVQ